MINTMENKPKRKNIKLQGYDYSENGGLAYYDLHPKYEEAHIRGSDRRGRTPGRPNASKLRNYRGDLV